MGIITNEPVIYDENTPLPTDPQMAAACVPGYVMANWTEEQLDQIIAAHKEIAFARTSPKQRLFNEQCSLLRATREPDLWLQSLGTKSMTRQP